MQFQGFTLDKFQEDAVAAVNRNHSVVVSAPTGSGKTLIADYIIDKFLQSDTRVIYTAPIKALSNQKYHDFCKDYGEDKIGLITGDIVINPNAQVVIMTTEVYRNMAIIDDPMLDQVSYCIMDEIHFINDEERGHVWEESIMFSGENVRFLFLSATIPNAEEFAAWVGKIKQHEVEVIRWDIRPVPLKIRFFDAELGITTLEKLNKKREDDDIPQYKNMYSRHRHVQKQKIPPPNYQDLVREIKGQDQMPCIFFVFSRAKTQEYALKLSKKKSFLSQNEYRKMAEITSTEYANLSSQVSALKSTHQLRQCISNGVAFHHAGLLPDVKHIIEKLFAVGLIKVLFATETFAVGINMPARCVCFDGLRKFTGVGFRYLTSKEFFQMSGRAGRRGIDKEGLAVAMVHRTREDIKKIDAFTKKDMLPLKSQFKLTYNTILNMVNMHSAEEITKILRMNYFTYQATKDRGDNRVLGAIKARYTKAVRILTQMGYIKDDKLTELGLFTTKIFSNELEVSQLFGTKFDYPIDEYFMILVLGALIYEPKRGVRFYEKFTSKQLFKFISVIKHHNYLRKGKWSDNIEKVTALIYPLFQQKKFIDILKNTNMLEGDVIRFFMQIMDKLEQIDRASEDFELTERVRNAKQTIRAALEGIHIF